MRKLYVTVPKSCADEVLLRGLTPENYGCMEPLSFIICRSDKPQVVTGQAAYFEFEVPDDDSNLRQVNPVQFEYHGKVHHSQLIAIAWPPQENWEVVEFESVEALLADLHDRKLITEAPLREDIDV